MKLLNRGTLFLSLLAGIVLIIISLVFTWSFFYSLSTGFLAFCFAVFGVVNDFGKVIFLPAVLVAIGQNKRGYAAFFGLLWTICFVISLIASQSFDLNQKNEIKNKNLVESSSYKRQTELYESTKKSVESLTADIERMKSNRLKDEEKIRADYQPRIDNAKRLNMLTINPGSVDELSKKRTKEISQLDENIRLKEKELSDKVASLGTINQNFENVGTKIEHTEGLLSFSHWLAGIFGGNPDTLIGWFYILKNVFSEFLALGLLLLGGMELKNESHLFPTAPDKPRKKLTDESTDILTEIHKEPKFKPLNGPQPQPQLKVLRNEYTKEIEEEIEEREYMKVCENPSRPGTCLAYQTIAKKMGITAHKASKIKARLEGKGILKVEGIQTVIVKRKAKMA